MDHCERKGESRREERRLKQRKGDERRNHREYRTIVSFTALCDTLHASLLTWLFALPPPLPPPSSLIPSTLQIPSPPSSCPPHPIRQGHADDGMYGWFSLCVSSSSHLITPVMHEKYAHVGLTFVCVCVCQGLYVDCVVILCVCVSVCFSVSASQKRRTSGSCAPLSLLY